MYDWPAFNFSTFAGVQIESHHTLSDVRKSQCQRQSHVTASDNSDVDVFAGKKLRLTIAAHSSSNIMFEFRAAHRSEKGSKIHYSNILKRL